MTGNWNAKAKSEERNKEIIQDFLSLNRGEDSPEHRQNLKHLDAADQI